MRTLAASCCAPPRGSLLSPGRCRVQVGEITLKHIYEIAKVKLSDPGQQNIPLQSHCKNIIGSCKSLGIRVLPKAEMEERLAQ